MGQKVNPNGFRLGGVTEWRSNWFINKKVLTKEIIEDRKIRKYLENRISNRANVTNIGIERVFDKIFVFIHCVKIWVVLGKNREEIYNIINELKKIVGGEVLVNVVEVKDPDLSAQLMGKYIASQIQNRMPYKRVIRFSLQKCMKAGAKGIKMKVSGRLNGGDIARSETFTEGSVPLHTLRAKIDYACERAQTLYGVIGVKVWIFKNEVFNTPQKFENENSK
ncbi:MAG: 30S ribosomal protein S3 [Cytophagales bacterium]|jgi:small subunit ribosomal protein S3|nr:30S ribosomal protein S3 [Cytophagales bacterium]